MPGDPLTDSGVDYYFGPYKVDGRLRRLYRDGEPLVLTPRVADTLVALLQRAGRVVEKDELLRAVWDDVIVGEDSLAQNISTLRRVLADDPSRPQFIATVPRRGYRFVAPVRTAPGQATGPASSVTPAPARHAGRRWLVPIVGLAALASIVTGLIVWQFRDTSPPRRSVHFTIPEPEAVRFSTSGGMMAISPDGQYLAFLVIDGSGSSTLRLRPLASTDGIPLRDTDGAAHPFWSPDSGTVAFFSGQRLKAVDIATGAVRVIASLPSSRATGATWSRRGQILFSVPNDGMYLVPASGGTPERLTPALDAACEGCGAWPHFLPDGRRFLYTVISSDRPGIYIGEIGKPGGAMLLDAPSSSTYVLPGFLSYARSGTLYVQRFDADLLRLTGTPIPLFDGLAYNVRTGRVIAAISDTGVLAFRGPPVTELVWVDRAGAPQGVAASPAAYQNFAIAPDGQRVAATRVDLRTGTSDVWVVGGEREIRITDDADWDGDPIWSDDGVFVIYSSRRGGRWRIHRRQAASIGPEELLLDTDSPVMAQQTLRSGHIVYASRRSSPPFDLWMLDQGEATPLVHLGGMYPNDARLSPDERWLAYMMPGAQGGPGSQTLYLSGPPPFGAARRVIAEGGDMPRWRADGRELFYLSRDSSVAAIAVNQEGMPTDSPGRVLFQAPGPAMTGISGQVYDVTPDGQRFLLKREVGPSIIHVVLNWDQRLDDQ